MNKQALRAPLARLFAQHLPEQTVHRLWLRIGRAELGRPRGRTMLLAYTASALFCLLLAAAAHFFPRPGSLRLASREKLPTAITSRDPSSVALDDGSRVELGPETLLDVLQSTDRAFVLALRTGRARFSVVPGGPRAWRIECGPVSVDVVGTVFSVERSSAVVRVQVERGRVLVTGQGVPDRVARLSANESLVVPIGAALPVMSAASPAASVVPLPSEPASAPAADASSASFSNRSATVARRLGGAEPSSAGRLPKPSAPVPPDPPIADGADVLLQRADMAQRAGAPTQAASLLQRLLTEHPHDARVPLAQFTLGRLYLDSLGEPGQAASYFAKALAGGIPEVLAEDAQARLVQALARSGNTARAANAAARYQERFPTGRHLQEVTRWAHTTPGP
jgi:transmembrane sensor